MTSIKPFVSGPAPASNVSMANASGVLETSRTFAALNHELRPRPRLPRELAPATESSLRRLGVLPPQRQPSQPVLQQTLPAMNSATPAGRAAERFQATWQAKVLDAPGSVQLTREQLGFGRDDIAMLDIGGEGQKSTHEFGGPTLKSGNAHAINVNTLTKISSTPLEISIEPHEPPRPILEGHIPNLIRPARQWPAAGDAALKLPFADGFSNLTLMEGAPLFKGQVAELHRITDPNGWMVLSVAPNFEPNIAALAELHSGGRRWVIGAGDELDFPRQILPPRNLSPEEAAAFAPRFDDVSSHELFDVVKQLASERQATSTAPARSSATVEMREAPSGAEGRAPSPMARTPRGGASIDHHEL